MDLQIGSAATDQLITFVDFGGTKTSTTGTFTVTLLNPAVCQSSLIMEYNALWAKESRPVRRALRTSCPSFPKADEAARIGDAAISDSV